MRPSVSKNEVVLVAKVLHTVFLLNYVELKCLLTLSIFTSKNHNETQRTTQMPQFPPVPYISPRGQVKRCITGGAFGAVGRSCEGLKELGLGGARSEGPKTMSSMEY